MDEDGLKRIIIAEEKETVRLEYKRGFIWSEGDADMTEEQARTIRAVLAFTNSRGAGTLIIGVNDDTHGNLDFVGCTPEQMASFNDLDKVQECINKYSSEPLSYTIKLFAVEKEDGSERQFVAIQINEFGKYPTLCIQDWPKGQRQLPKSKYKLIRDDMYVRGLKGKPSSKKATELELRRILDMVEDKNEERLVELFDNITEKTVKRFLEKYSGTTKHPKAPKPYTKRDKDL
ncbi:MAG TPA: RNA-binding domain-containing protein [Candidatus Saccharimonadales bacterium]